MTFRYPAALALTATLTLFSLHAENATVQVGRNDLARAGTEFAFTGIPKPIKNDLAADAKFEVVAGLKDFNGGGLEKLHDGLLPSNEDDPGENFFFRAGSEGGRILVDLGKVSEIAQINTYSWHVGGRAPQVFSVYGSDGASADFNAKPGREVNPLAAGWKLVGKVDTRGSGLEAGGQYGASLSAGSALLGKFRYLLLDVQKTDPKDPFGQTFFSEIDVVAPGTTPVAATSAAQASGQLVEAGEGKYRIRIDASETPDLKEWVDSQLIPMVREWYPRLVTLLPTPGYEAPRNLSIVISQSMRGVAATSGTRVVCSADWVRQNLKGEARGAVIHELVHVIQQYGRAPRVEGSSRAPGWLVEGIPDYIRWYIFEPESKGAEISPARAASARFDASYRVSANFLNWATRNGDEKLIEKLNAVCRQGKYREDLWKEWTGKSVQDLGEAWKKNLEVRVAQNGPVESGISQKPNELTEAERQSGWKLLFDGKSLDGWHSFKMDKVRPGWQVTNGTLACVNPRDAGDLCTNEKYDSFELQIDFNMSVGGNSGIMFHVTDEGRAAWATGPEIQLQDNRNAHDPQLAGWLYGLYKPAIDPKTEKPIDSTKPAGEWNHLRVVISPEKCVHEMNGVKYVEYVLNDADFKKRVSLSKFAFMPGFAKSESGYISLQGDHGQVSFRNIKIRRIPSR